MGAEKIYLSLDLDFFNYQKDDKLKNYFLSKLGKLKKGITYVVPSHHHLLPHINKSKCDHLINVDWHSDISDGLTDTDLCCGSWVNFVRWRKTSNFTWLYPRKVCYNDKGHDSNTDHGCCWTSKDVNPFLHDTEHEWASINHFLFDKSLINWNNIEQVGIAVSPNWVHNFNRLEEFFDIYNIPDRWAISYHEELIRGRLKR